jgi:hypothetical protein
MAWKFNPFSGQLEESAGAGGLTGSGLTTNSIVKYNGSVLVNSRITDDGTTSLTIRTPGDYVNIGDDEATGNQTYIGVDDRTGNKSITLNALGYSAWGDTNAVANNTNISINDSTKGVQVNSAGAVSMGDLDEVTSQAKIVVNSAAAGNDSIEAQSSRIRLNSRDVSIGDAENAYDGTKLTINDTTGIIEAGRADGGTAFRINIPDGLSALGDIDNVADGTVLIVDGLNNEINIRAASSLTVTAPTVNIGSNGAAVKIAGVKRYVALLTQSGTDAPVAIVLENTTGVTVSYLFTDDGSYEAHVSSPILLDSKTVVMPMGATVDGLFNASQAEAKRTDVSTIAIFAGGSGAGLNGQLSATYFSFEVYP